MTKGKRTRFGAIVGAIGVVFGDIGTSPLYVLPAIFVAGNIPITRLTVHGSISLIVWTLVAVVSVKYLLFIMHADNRGEGGIIALVSQLQRAQIRPIYKRLAIVIGLIGMGLFFGDSSVTPAISVLSAVEGIVLLSPALSTWVVPITLGILVGLFALQSRGSGNIGRLFGPIMIAWFFMIAAGGATHIITSPEILASLLPSSALSFIVAYPLIGFFVLGAVILSVTGAEALYADMGHFGRIAITKAWYVLIFPALLLNYMGQGALLLHTPAAIHSPFFMLYPTILHPIVVFVATVATIIASQAVISGAFSLAHQAIQLGYLPRLLVRYTSRDTEGQVYVPAVNWMLMVVVCVLVIGFGSSAHLAAAYGLAVSGALLIDTLLFVAVLGRVKGRGLAYVSVFATVFILLDSLFVVSASTKVLAGGWVPLLIALLTCILLLTWVRGHDIVTRERHKKEQPLPEFVRLLKGRRVTRLPGHAVYLGSHEGYAPLALETSVHQLHELHEKVAVVTVETIHQPHVPEKERIVFDGLKSLSDGISHVRIRYGFADHPNVPRELEYARALSPELDFNPYTATYFVSQQKPVIEHSNHLTGIEKHIYLAMARNAVNASDYYHLPPNTTIQMSTYVGL